MRHPIHLIPRLTIGIDLGDSRSAYSIINRDGNWVERATVPTNEAAFRKRFGKWQPCRVVIEACNASAWVAALLEELGHEVIVANGRAMMQSPRRGRRKSDRSDADGLARLGRCDVALLAPITHRSKDARLARSLLVGRDCAVGARTKLINCLRGSLKTHNVRLPKCSTEALPNKIHDLPSELEHLVRPMIDLIEQVTAVIRRYDKMVEATLERQYPEASRLLRQIKGVGPVTALAFAASIENPERFPNGRVVGAYLGLVPRLDESGETSGKSQLRISKAGDPLLRRLLIQAAHYIVGGLNKQDSALRQWALMKIGSGSDRIRKRKIIVATARKLAVLLHALLRSGEDYEPFRDAVDLDVAVA